MKRLTYFEPVEFSDESLTERGERVYTTLRITTLPPSSKSVSRTIKADKGLGFTEEWIEETVQGCLQALEKDFPAAQFKVVRTKPNDIRLEYAGVRMRGVN